MTVSKTNEDVGIAVYIYFYIQYIIMQLDFHNH